MIRTSRILRGECWTPMGLHPSMADLLRGSGLLGMQPTMNQVNLQAILGICCRPIVLHLRCRLPPRCMRTVTLH